MRRLLRILKRIPWLIFGRVWHVDLAHGFERVRSSRPLMAIFYHSSEMRDYALVRAGLIPNRAYGGWLDCLVRTREGEVAMVIAMGIGGDGQLTLQRGRGPSWHVHVDDVEMV